MEDQAIIEADISHIEVASVNFDQWMLTVGLRTYDQDQLVKGMVHVVFTEVRGFRYLDEGDMLRYPFPAGTKRHYVQVVDAATWSQQESDFGNMITLDHTEYLIASDNECLCILAYQPPQLIKET